MDPPLAYTALMSQIGYHFQLIDALHLTILVPWLWRIKQYCDFFPIEMEVMGEQLIGYPENAPLCVHPCSRASTDELVPWPMTRCKGDERQIWGQVRGRFGHQMLNEVMEMAEALEFF
jgi:hypothetical protein